MFKIETSIVNVLFTLFLFIFEHLAIYVQVWWTLIIKLFLIPTYTRILIYYILVSPRQIRFDLPLMPYVAAKNKIQKMRACWVDLEGNKKAQLFRFRVALQTG